MRFEVPQFIEIEDKIVGPLTWRQFIYLAGGAGMLLLTYFTLPLILFVLIGIPFGALAGFLAFHKVNNRPFSQFLEATFNYFTKSRLYLWRKAEPQTFVEKTEKTYSAVPVNLDFTNKQSISSLSRKLDLHLPNDTTAP